MNDEPAEVKSFIQEKGIVYPVVIDNTGDMTFKYRIRGHPTSIFINQAGVITGIIPGLASPEMLDKELAKAME